MAEMVWQARVRGFVGRASSNVLNVFLGAGLIGWILYLYGVPWQWLGPWSVAVLVFTVLLVVVDRQMARVTVTAANRRWVLGARIAAGAALFLCYGVAPALLSGPGHLLPHTWLVLIISTALVVNAISYAAMPQYLVALNVASMLPLTLDLAYHAWSLMDRDYLVLTVMAVLWQSTVMLKVHSVAGTAIGALESEWRLRQEMREHEVTRAQIQHMAMHDDLTGLANRRYFEQVFARTLHQAKRGQGNFALVMLDLNDFKAVNDNLGHAAGDEVLRVAAQRLQTHIRAGDFAARLGGDEFALLLPQLRDPADVAPVVAKLQAQLAEPLEWQGRPIALSGSMGWACYPQDGQDPDQLQALADERMYRAKASRTA